MNDSSQQQRRFHVRGLTSFVVTLTFALAAFSGTVLYFAPRGRDANWAGWTFLGLWRENWGATHIIVTVLFLVFGIIHLIYNWKPLWNYCYSRVRGGINLWRELLVAVVLVFVLVTLAILELPPSREIVSLSDKSKDAWSKVLPRGPIPHAELLTITDLSKSSTIEENKLVHTLTAAGIEVESAGQSLMELALENDTTPASLFDILLEKYPKLANISGRGRGRGKGAGPGKGQGHNDPQGSTPTGQ